MSLRDEIAQVEDVEKVEAVLDWKVSKKLYVKGIDGIALECVQSEVSKQESGDKKALSEIGLLALLISKCLCEEDGTLVLDDAEGVEILSKKSVKTLKTLGAQCQEVNGLSAESVEAISKNS